jgi:small-conductance mechanosensitive channel
VLNHSYTTRNIRIAVQVQVSSDSDIERALTLMEEIARRHPRVRNEPDPPTAYLANFVDNGVNLELGVWIGDPEKGQLNLKSALNREIFAAFRENGIKQPFPQLDVRQIDTPSARPASPDAAKPTEDRVPNAKDKS